MKSKEQIINIYTEVILKVALVALGLYFLYLIRDIIALFFVAVVVMAAIDPLVSWFGKSKIPRPVGVLSIYLFLIVVIGAAFSVLVPAITSQSKAFVEDLPHYLESLNSILIGININTQEVVSNIGEGISGSSLDIFSKTIGVFSAAFSFIVVLSMAFYMSIIKNGMESFLKSLTPKKYEEKVIDTALIIKEKIGRWMLGQLLLMFVIFALDYMVLCFVDVPYALAIAIIGGILEIVPYVGPVVSTIVAVLIGTFTSPVKGLLVFLFYVLIQQAENHIIVPQIMKKAVGLNPLAIIFSILVGMKIAGVAGVILAVPVATAVSVVIDSYSKDKA
ncbi:MAG: AI-2E family transporter [Candidatus Moranbacteria bacterium]|nr:AI-2E family transporter [Candidatus Moranbacteria bacterium]